MLIRGMLNAEEEAKRFLACVQKYKDTHDYDDARSYLKSSKESGAIRRSSMDLTRALADLRQNR